MRRAKIIFSTPFRLAFVFILMLLLTFLVSGLIVYHEAKHEITNIHNHRLKEIFNVMASDGPEDLIATVRQRLAASGHHGTLLLLVSPDGNRIAGNIPMIRPHPGFSDMPGEELGFKKDYSYRLLEGEVDGYRLVVGISNAEVEELAEVLAGSLSWAFLGGALLAVAGAIILAIRTRRRLSAISDTMEQASRGDLSVRIPLIGNNDDIDLISSKVNETLASLAVAVEGIRQVSADIAHDLKSPLNRLKIIIEAALVKAAKGQDVTADLEAASKESDRINETFSALLSITQIASGARRARFRPTDIAAVLEDTGSVYQDVAEDVGMNLLMAGAAAGGPLIPGDRDLLTQMFANLIENAIRHCPAGTRIELKCEIDEARHILIVTIADDGPGIPEEEREKVFRRLYRLEKSRTTPGSGLGLSMVKAIAELHGATISLGDNAPGLKITIRFPLADSGTARTAPREDAARPGQPRSPIQ